MHKLSERSLPNDLKNAHNWVEKQFSKASKFVRSLSQQASEGQIDVSEQVQASDGEFFEQLIVPNTPVTVEAYNGSKRASIKTFQVKDEKELSDLYVEALYTILHRVGHTSDSDVESQLKSYVQQAFGFDDKRHQELMIRANEEKPPVVLLNVILLEAKNLIAKDINGFSDPFSMMGVIPGQYMARLQQTNNAHRTSLSDYSDRNRDENTNHNRRNSVLHHPIDLQHHKLVRLGGSLRRKIGSRKSKNGNDCIPAKLIKASSVQHKTLNPKWNEKFQFLIDDVAVDKFHMDIWDHDEEERSVIDAAKMLNQISGIKVLGRYFKEVAQSARADSSDATDDFLGCITLSIKDIPPEGIEKWYRLDKRSDRSEVSGHVRLKLWLSTKEERNIFDDEDLIDVKQHIKLIKQFALHEMGKSETSISGFRGSLPSNALAILSQHAIQGDLIDLHQAMCAWIAYSSMVDLGLSYSFLHEMLTDLISKWSPLILDKDEENMLGDSFVAFDQHCRTSILSHRIHFPITKREALDSLDSLLMCMKLLNECAIFEKCVTYHRSSLLVLSSAIETSAEAWFREALDETKCEDALIQFLQLLNILNNACNLFVSYNPIFLTHTNINYGALTYQRFNKVLEEYICSEMMSESTVDLKSLLINSYKRDDDDGKSLVLLMRIHFAFNEFRSYSTKAEVGANELNYIFEDGIAKWVEVVRVKAFARTELACKLDAPIKTNNAAKYTTSYCDICHMITKIANAWERVRIYDISLRIELTRKIVQNICKIAEYYVDRIFAQLATDGYVGELQLFVPEELLKMFCAAINNAEQVRRSLMFHNKLHLDEIATASSNNLKCDQQWKVDIEKKLDECDQYIDEQITVTINRLIRRLNPQLNKHIFHLAWSPTACAIELAIKPLITLLDEELSRVHRALLHKNFSRIMLMQFKAVIPHLQNCIDENAGLDPTFYKRLSDACTTLTDFFHANGKGISMEKFDRIPEYQKLLSILALNQTTTPKLIEQYYKDLLTEQNNVSECKYGILNVRAYYNANSKTLVIDVIGAKQVIPLDSNGLSDPFVVIELVPRVLYPTQPVVKTRVVNKTLNPIFDETFEFSISSQASHTAMVHFIVMDHDFLRSNDYAGEAFLELTDIPGFTITAGSTLRQFNLILIHPSRREDNQSVGILSTRTNDKDALEFIKLLDAGH